MYNVWKNGSKFDEWTESFNYQIWKNSFTKTNLNPDFFYYRSRDEKEILHLDHIGAGPGKKFLWSDYQTALKVSQETSFTPLKKRVSVHLYLLILLIL